MILPDDEGVRKTLKKLSNKEYRLNHLYSIINKEGQSVKFKFNFAQKQTFDNLHTRNVILKARQLGISTFCVLYLLDEIINKGNISAGIVSYSLEHAQYIFKKIIGHALDNLPSEYKKLFKVVQLSAREMTLDNGSSLRVDTTLRGGSYQLILVSEYGKTCARDPMKAEEVLTGTLQAISSKGMVIVESTAEGNDGIYRDMITQAVLHQNNLSDLDYKLHFFPWFCDISYIIDDCSKQIPYELIKYFAELHKNEGITLSNGQKNWYELQSRLLSDKIKQEFPSTVQEAFLSSSEAYYFQKEIAEARVEGRIINSTPYDAMEPVYVSMDIGATDLTVMIFFQVLYGEIRIIDYYADTNKGVDFYCRFLQYDKRYIYREIFLPHDSRQKDGIIVENTYESEFKKLFSHLQTRITVLKKTDVMVTINNAKSKFKRCVFFEQRTGKLIEQLGKYRKSWSEQLGRYIDKPFHDLSSNFADAYRYAMQAVTSIETSGNIKGSFEKHQKTVNERIGKI